MPLVVLITAGLTGVDLHSLAAQELTSADVENAIGSGMTWLENEQKQTNGRWSTIPPHTGGVDCLATLALILAGADNEGPHVLKSLRYLNSLQPVDDNLTVYTVSLMAMIYCEVDADLYRSRIRKCVEYLVQAQQEHGPQRGGWAYEMRGGNPDGSNTQFAILALSDGDIVASV